MTKKRLFSLILAVVMLLTTSLSANAYSAWYTIYTNGILYRCRCECDVNNVTAYAQMRAEVINSQTALPNYILLVAVLYNQNDAVVASGSRYNESPTKTMTFNVATSTPGTYTANGSAYFFNGQINEYGNYVYNGVTLYDDDAKTFPAPSSSSFSPIFNSSSSTSYQTDRYGNTYGSMKTATSFEEIPNYIYAVGNNGCEGYVSKADLLGLDLPISETEDEKSSDFQRIISVYDMNKNIIDTFTVGGTCSYDD